jgi:N-acetylglucosaminyldiphosphoundecaprenol N-acetyl-beta-D-mannosaminyltransferase
VRQWWKMQIMQPRTVSQEEPEVIVNDNAALFQIRGRLDISNLADFTAQAEQALKTSAFLVVDLSETTFLDSSALGALVTLANHARAMGGTLTLAAVPPRIMQTLSLVRLDQFFEIRADVEHALTTQDKPQQIFDEPVADDTGWRVIKMPYSLEASSVPQMIEMCTAYLSGRAQLVLDFSETEFLSSAGLMAMTKLDRQTKELGGELRIAGCSKDVMRSIQLAKLDTLVSIYHDVQAAIYENIETIEMHRVA